jgi:hypothetical protein
VARHAIGMRGVAAAAAVGALALAALVGPAAAATAPVGACADVVFMGARGSGQPQGGSADDGGTGLGPQVHAVEQRLAGRLPGRAIAVHAVQYPAQGVELLALDPAAYLAGLEQGVAAVRTELRERAAQCPDERIVLAGYSQGAMVMHRAVQDLAAAGDTAVLARTDGVVLIADGDRRRVDNQVDYGSAGRSRGIAYSLRPDSGIRGGRLPASMRTRIHSVCVAFDVVCDYQPRRHTGAGAVAGAQIHSQGYAHLRALDRAADAVAARLAPR